MKKVLSIAMVLCLVATLFAGCSGLATTLNETKILGTWEGSKETGFLGTSIDVTYTFEKDGVGEMPLLDSFVNASADFTYTIEEDTLTINVDTDFFSETYIYTIAFEEDNLILTDGAGDVLTLTKVAE